MLKVAGTVAVTGLNPPGAATPHALCIDIQGVARAFAHIGGKRVFYRVEGTTQTWSSVARISVSGLSGLNPSAVHRVTRGDYRDYWPHATASGHGP